MRIIKSSSILLLLLFFNSCKNTEYLSNDYGKIIATEVQRIEYYEGSNYLSSSPSKKPNAVITDEIKIAEIVSEINYSNNPGTWKGAHWDKVIIVLKDSYLIYSTNGNVIGIDQSSGTFYQLKEGFIQRYFNK
jgi:hypothetical protein